MILIHTLASLGGTELLVIAIVCKEVAVAKQWENMGTPSGAASLVKKRFSEALKARIRYLKHNGPVSMTTPTSSIVMLVSAMLVAKMIFRTPAGGLSNTNLMGDGSCGFLCAHYATVT